MLLKKAKSDIPVFFVLFCFVAFFFFFPYHINQLELAAVATTQRIIQAGRQVFIRVGSFLSLNGPKGSY